MAMCSVVLLLPSLRLFVWWQLRGKEIVPLDYLISSYAQGFWILLVLGAGMGFVVWLLATIIFYLIAFAIFGTSHFQVDHVSS